MHFQHGMQNVCLLEANVLCYDPSTAAEQENVVHLDKEGEYFTRQTVEDIYC